MAETLRLVTKTQKSKAKRSVKKKFKAHKVSSLCVLGVVTVLIILSLSHLATGIAIITNSEVWQSWAMAIGIDTGYVTLEVAILTTPVELRTKISRIAIPTIIGTLIGSAALNALAFSSYAIGWMTIPAVSLGCAIPALIYALTRVSAILYTGRS